MDTNKITLKEQLKNFVAHLNTYRKKREEFLDSSDVGDTADYYEVTVPELRKMLKKD